MKENEKHVQQLHKNLDMTQEQNLMKATRNSYHSSSQRKFVKGPNDLPFWKTQRQFQDLYVPHKFAEILNPEFLALKSKTASNAAENNLPKVEQKTAERTQHREFIPKEVATRAQINKHTGQDLESSGNRSQRDQMNRTGSTFVPSETKMKLALLMDKMHTEPDCSPSGCSPGLKGQRNSLIKPIRIQNERMLYEMEREELHSTRSLNTPRKMKFTGYKTSANFFGKLYAATKPSDFSSFRQELQQQTQSDFFSPRVLDAKTVEYMQDITAQSPSDDIGSMRTNPLKLIYHMSQNKDFKKQTPRKDVAALNEWFDDMNSTLANEEDNSIDSHFLKVQKVYAVCLKELIRQVALDCSERGQFLEKIWNCFMHQIENVLLHASKGETRKEIELLKKLNDTQKRYEKDYEELKVKYEHERITLAAREREIENMKVSIEILKAKLQTEEQDAEVQRETIFKLHVDLDKANVEKERLLQEREFFSDFLHGNPHSLPPANGQKGNPKGSAPPDLPRSMTVKDMRHANVDFVPAIKVVSKMTQTEERPKEVLPPPAPETPLFEYLSAGVQTDPVTFLSDFQAKKTVERDTTRRKTLSRKVSVEVNKKMLRKSSNIDEPASALRRESHLNSLPSNNEIEMIGNDGLPQLPSMTNIPGQFDGPGEKSDLGLRIELEREKSQPIESQIVEEYVEKLKKTEEIPAPHSLNEIIAWIKGSTDMKTEIKNLVLRLLESQQERKSLEADFIKTVTNVIQKYGRLSEENQNLKEELLGSLGQADELAEKAQDLTRQNTELSTLVSINEKQVEELGNVFHKVKQRKDKMKDLLNKVVSGLFGDLNGDSPRMLERTPTEKEKSGFDKEKNKNATQDKKHTSKAANNNANIVEGKQIVNPNKKANQGKWEDLTISIPLSETVQETNNLLAEIREVIDEDDRTDDLSPALTMKIITPKYKNSIFLKDFSSLMGDHNKSHPAPKVAQIPNKGMTQSSFMQGPQSPRSPQRIPTTPRSTASPQQQQKTQAIMATIEYGTLFFHSFNRSSQPKASQPVSNVMKVITQLYQDKLKTMKQAGGNQPNQTLEIMLYGSFLQRFGLRKVAEPKVKAFLEGCLFYTKQYRRVNLFCRFLGIVEPSLNNADLSMYLECHNIFHENLQPMEVFYVQKNKVIEVLVARFTNQLGMKETSNLIEVIESIPRDEVDFDQVLERILKITSSRRLEIKDHLDNNEMIELHEFLILFRLMEPKAYSEDTARKLFDRESDMISPKTGERVMSLLQFASMCSRENMFTEERLKEFIASSSDLSSWEELAKKWSYICETIKYRVSLSKKMEPFFKKAIDKISEFLAQEKLFAASQTPKAKMDKTRNALWTSYHILEAEATRIFWDNETRKYGSAELFYFYDKSN